MMEDLNMTKALGLDGVLKECRDQLAHKVYKLITLLRKGVVPKDWKKADIFPIYKNGSKEEPSNYRPVSLTSVVAKMCERIVKQRWSEYMEKREILTDRQFRFKKGRSCVMNLMCFYSRVIDIIQEREGWGDYVYLDLKKAFDKVPHKRLLWKLGIFGGQRGVVPHWIINILRGKEMRTVIKERKLSWRLHEHLLMMQN